MKDNLISCITLHEGLRLKPYKDTKEFLTIGVGRNLTTKGITESEALIMLNNDIADCRHELSVYDWYKELDLVRQEVMIELCFNMGLEHLLEFKEMIHCLKEKNWSLACENLSSSLWSKEVGHQRTLNISNRLSMGLYNNVLSS